MARTEREERMLNRLQAGARNLSCGVHLEALSPLQRNELYTTLLFDRLQRKMRTVTELWEEATRNWNQTFYLMYFRTLGDRTNQAVYLELARRVPYRIVLRERLAPHAVEAMLLGCSGLLDLYRDDSYTLDLRRSFEYLAAKYSLERLDAQACELAGIRPANHPVLRLAQAAEFFTQDEFIMQRAMECCNENDVRRLFRVEASEYWRTHYIPGAASLDTPKRLGNFKANIIGINLVAVLQYAYGSYTGHEALRDRSLTLLERLEAEDNRYIRAWLNSCAPAPANAFETQALLQLATEYCAERRCTECPLGRRLLQRAAETH